MSQYLSFIQRFRDHFQQEISCEDQEATIGVIINLMDKCGLKELLETTVRVPGKRHPSPNTNSSSDSKSGKKLTGFNIYIKERMASYRESGNPRSMPEVAKEWSTLSEMEKYEYKQKAKHNNSK